MEWLETAVVIVHVLVSLGLIALVLMQQGKGAEAGASFGGGASQTVFGSQGSGTFLTKTTKYLALVFFTTSFSLAVIAKQKAEVEAAESSILNPVAETLTTIKEGEEGSAIDDSDDSGKSLELEAVEESQSAAPELE